MVSDIVVAHDYYPYGLPLPGREITEESYRYGYQGQFAEEDEETGWNSFELRMYDPVTGRWMVPDPYRQFWSSYIGMGNDPINLIDPNGGISLPDLGFLNDPILQERARGTRILDELIFSYVPNFNDVISDLGALVKSMAGIDRQFGVMFYGRGSEDIFSGTDYEVGMAVAEINLDDFEQLMGTLFPFSGDPNRPKVDNISRTVRNPNLQDKAKNLAEAIKISGKLKDLLSQSVLEQHASRHNALIRVPQDTIVERRTTVLGGKKRLKFNQERVIYVNGFGQPVDTIDINE